MSDIRAAWVDAYSPQLLRWAWGKTGDRSQAEDLVQEVWLQFFSAVAKEQAQGREIGLPERLLWRVARYVWLHSLRQKTAHPLLPLDDSHPDPTDFAADIARRQEQSRQSAWLRQRIVNLNRLQREAMILYYLEQLPQKEIARRLGVSEATLRWHLFDVRKKLREEASIMHEHEPVDFVYRPHTLNMGLNGIPVPNCAVSKVRGNLLMQNICCACYDRGRTAQELAGMLGVARPYIEHDLQWLCQQELIREHAGCYCTDFLIMTSEQEAAVFRVFEQHKETLCDVITGHFLTHEAAIRALGFTGCDRPMSKLLWLLIYLFTRRLPLPVETPEPPIRPDGGKYWPLGFDRTDPAESPRQGFAYNGSMSNAGFFWFGLHDFGQSEIEDMMDAWTPEYMALRTLLKKLIHAGFDPACVAEEERFVLAQLAEKGFVTVTDGRIAPNFVIFSSQQYERLYAEIFLPLIEALKPELDRLAEDLHSLSMSRLPPHLKHLAPLAQAMAQHDVGFTTELMAFHDGTLYRPVSKRDGEFLTLAYVIS